MVFSADAHYGGSRAAVSSAVCTDTQRGTTNRVRLVPLWRAATLSEGVSSS